jgi:tRNA (mo5U34)-methyltransferase
VESKEFVWHQRFELEKGVYTPGAHNVEWLLDAAGVDRDLSGASVLDVGTSNGGAAFLAERRGADRIVAVDILPPTWFGFDRIAAHLGSRVQFVRATVYDLPRILTERFDIVFFFGVLYHLRHPLLALDALRRVAGSRVFLESVVADANLSEARGLSVAQFFRGDELGGDASNWFAPTINALEGWCASSGFDIASVTGVPVTAPERAILRLSVSEGDPEFEHISYERSLYRPEGALPPLDG